MNDREENILDVAEKVFAKSGFQKSTIREISRIAGVNSAMLSYYFISKEKLLYAVLQRRINHFDKISILQSSSPTTMSQALLDVVSLNIKLIRGNISFFKFLVQEQLLNSCNESGQIINDYLKLRLNYVRNLLVYGVETGEFRQLDIDLTCMFITGTLINGLLFNTHYVSQQVSDTAFDERLLKNFKEYINHMLKS